MKTIILSLLLALLFFFLLKSTLVAQSNWITINSGISSEDYLTDIQFVNSAVGFIVGTRGIVLKTTDSGLSWEQKSSGLSLPLSKYVNRRVFAKRSFANNAFQNGSFGTSKHI